MFPLESADPSQCAVHPVFFTGMIYESSSQDSSVCPHDGTDCIGIDPQVHAADDLFKNSVDQSPKKYINDKKLERSCQMLLENRYTISEISLRLGYSSIHYFSKSFNMKYHMSPSEFVKQNCQSSV